MRPLSAIAGNHTARQTRATSTFGATTTGLARHGNTWNAVVKIAWSIQPCGIRANSIALTLSATAFFQNKAVEVFVAAVKSTVQYSYTLGGCHHATATTQSGVA